MKINVNKGMYLETIINNSAKYYEARKIAILRKQWVPIEIHYKNKNQLIGNIRKKCDVDYYGMWKNNFIAIEAKQCLNDNFDTSRIKKHQKDFLSLIEELGGLSYIIIYFQKKDVIFLVNWKKYLNYTKQQKSINFLWFKNNCLILNVIFPGWIDIIQGIKSDLSIK